MYKLFADLRTGFLAIFCALFLTLAPALAQDGLFTVSDVLVDVTAENAIKAREQAFAQAQGDAFKILAERMLPEMEAESFTPPDAAVISPMILDFEVTKEQLSSTRYVGTYTFSFSPGAVRSYFGARNVTYSDVKSRPVLILPFLEIGGQQLLWSPFNVWAQAWNRAEKLQSGLVPLVVPLGDLADAQDISDNEAMHYDRQKLANIVKRYETGEAVMVVATPNEALAGAIENDSPAQGIITIRLYRTDRNAAEASQELNIER
ncbi:MAG: DUF2066 domain-containing protein [Alphaproteobacteria bacterium]|nr:DUF2066 domain-containing protein [Alphaproteobacteria bacterium]